MAITADTTLAELAAIVSQALEAAGIRATLSGGAAVSIYTDNEYQSLDLDFVTTARRKQLTHVDFDEPTAFAHDEGADPNDIVKLREQALA